MVTALQAFIMAVFQGLTEFLPVSSSGHLAILSAMFNINGDAGLLMAVTMHIGSLGAIVVFYFRTLIGLLKKENWKVIGFIAAGSVPAGIFGIALKKTGLANNVFSNLYLISIGFIVTATLLIIAEKISNRNQIAAAPEKENWRIIRLVFAGSVPAWIIGFVLKKYATSYQIFCNIYLAAVGVAVLIALFAAARKISRRYADTGSRDNQPVQLNCMTLKQALIIGCVQAVAVLPGISRSGSTICSGLMLKLSRKNAAAFSFLLALPAIAGSGLLEFKDYLELNATAHSEQTPDWKILLFSLLVSALVSFGALKLLIKLLQKGNWVIFSYYLYNLGGVLLIWLLTNDLLACIG